MSLSSLDVRLAKRHVDKRTPVEPSAEINALSVHPPINNSIALSSGGVDSIEAVSSTLLGHHKSTKRESPRPPKEGHLIAWPDGDKFTTAGYTPFHLGTDRRGPYEPSQPIRHSERITRDYLPRGSPRLFCKVTRHSRGIRLASRARSARCGPS